MSSHQQFNVGVKGLVFQNGRVLVLRAKGEEFWELPGGRIDKGEQVEDTLRREMAEELGKKNIVIGDVVHAQMGQYPLSKSLRLMLLMFRVDIKRPNNLALSSEHTDSRWVSLNELSNLTIPLPDLTAIHKLLQPSP